MSNVIFYTDIGNYGSVIVIIEQKEKPWKLI